MQAFRKLLLPFSWLYGLAILLRHFLFDVGFFISKKYDIPVICVGNLRVGGTGKTPMVEYLLNFLKETHQVAVLSRGYKRKTSGFLLASDGSNAQTLGDEPFQYFSKFKEVFVAVDENRQRGIDTLLRLKNPDVIVLDDAFQHRKVKAGVNILLTAYGDLYVDDFLLPAGNLRDLKSRASKAQIIMVTKCPENLSVESQQQIGKRLKLKENQQLFFSTVVYDNHVFSEDSTVLLENFCKKPFALVTGIANAGPLAAFLKKIDARFEHFEFNDHHYFSEDEIKMLKTKPVVLTTEKDYGRLKSKLPGLYYLPIKPQILNNQNVFNQLILNFIKKAR